ncbi:bifunctional diguanylate cyclase/phosphodiesterase [Rhodovastum atsumiense]|uniref:bifunctional diguanylate cyclase/phosphodiesterase n=1 Tax=Rhodovastum atsumiense TaxID=504468 RepID=UPI00139F2CED|nr:EAL domain-containing protein [Rhodovastum atsumiense]
MAGGRPGFWRGFAGAGLGLALTLGAAGYLAQHREADLQEAERELRNLSLVLANWVEDSFRAVALLQAGVVQWVGSESIDTTGQLRERFASREVHDALHARTMALPRVQRLFLADANGQVIVTSTPGAWPTPEVSVAGKDYFELLRTDPGRDSVLSSALRSQMNGHWNIFFARRLTAPDGRFLGIIGASIDLAYFEDFFARLNLGTYSSIALNHSDGALLVRHPRNESFIGVTTPLSATFRQVTAADGSGTLRARSPVDETDRIMGLRVLKAYPLVMIATRATSEVLAPWRQEVRRIGLGVLLTDALILGGILLINRKDRQRRALQAARTEAEAKLARSEERERAARTLAERDAALSAVFENGMAGVAEVEGFAGPFVRVNHRYCEMTGRTETDLLGGLTPIDVMHPEDWPRTAALWQEAAGSGGKWETELRHLRPDGTEIWTRLSIAVSARDAQGGPLRHLAIVQDITESRAAAERLRASEALLRLGMEIGHIGSFSRDLLSGEIQCGPETRVLFGLPPDEAPLSMEDLLVRILPEDQARVRRQIGEAVARCQPEIDLQYRFHHRPDDMVRHAEIRARYEYDAAGRPLRSVGVVIDVTERRATEARIAHLARHDALTGLPNRLLFRERLDEALARAQRGGGFGVLCLDLDRFKDVNDSLGHPAGDALLREVARRLQAELRETDTLARLDGDEFAIIQADVHQPQDVTALARRVIEMVGLPCELDGHQLVIGSSVGIALAPADGTDADALLKGADMALYRAKAEGRGCWRFFEPGMDARMQTRRTLETDLRRAMVAREFELFYQPIVEIPSRRVSGLEALLRWRHPERGLVPPDAFIPLAEEIGLIVAIGEWALARACAEATTWAGAPKVAVNLSSVQFASRGLVDAVAAALERSGLDPARLELEITETVMLQETEATLATLRQLKALGVRIAMDDFGTGYSSLSYLQRFPFDKVKIDRCFTRDLEGSRQSKAIVRAVAGMCAGLDMTTTAEGVETEAQFQVLSREGCGEAQGYLFSRPLPAGEIPALMEQLAQAARFSTAAE